MFYNRQQHSPKTNVTSQNIQGAPKVGTFMINFTTDNKYRRSTNDALRNKSIDIKTKRCLLHTAFSDTPRNKRNDNLLRNNRWTPANPFGTRTWLIIAAMLSTVVYEQRALAAVGAESCGGRAVRPLAS